QGKSNVRKQAAICLGAGILLFFTGCETQDPNCNGGTNSQGERTGAWTCKFPQGQKQEQAIYKKGIREGAAIFWHRTGQRRKAGDFKQGEEDGAWTFWYSSGQLEKKGGYKDGVEHGPWVFWDESGRREKQGEYREGKQFGEWAVWDRKTHTTLAALYPSDPPEDWKSLVTRLEDGEESAVDEIVAKGRKDAVPVLAKLLKNSSGQLRSQAALALSKFGPDASPAVKVLIETFRRTEESHQAVSAALVAVGEPSVLQLRNTLANDRAAQVRKMCATTLGGLGAKGASAATALEHSMTNDPIEEVQQAAALALGFVGARAELENALKTGSSKIRGFAAV
ncbi:MAG: hypothetical protein N2C14_07820, partial [Planctomycetales bacterium]